MWKRLAIWPVVPVLLLSAACSAGGEQQPLLAPLEGAAAEPVHVQPVFQGSIHDTEPLAGLAPEGVRIPLPAPWAPAPMPSGILAPEVSARAAVVIDDASGAVLYSKDAFTPLPPASTTKVATAIVAIEHGGLETDVTTDVDAAAMPRSSVMGLRPGDTFTVRDLLYGLLLPSGNDAALAIARHVSGSDEAFVGEMNGLLARLGMDGSHFANPHGLGARNHLISARDLAFLERYAMTLPEFRDIIRTYSYQARGSRTIGLTSSNSLVFAYPGADSAKIGYTRSAGNTLVASASRDGHRIFVVVFNAATRDADAAALLDWAFANHAWN
jgi:D-alanyl-D-alanine carboxypeptidase